VSATGESRLRPIPSARRGRAQVSLAGYRRAGTAEKPVIEIATSTPTVQESPSGDTACWTLTADVAPARDTVVPLQIQGDANGADSARDGDYKTLEGTVTIPAGQSNQQFCTTIFDDRIVEDDEEITVVIQVQFGNDPNFVVGPTDRATVTIEDDDTGTPVITISADSAKVNEGQGATFRLRSTLELNRGLDIFVTIGGSMTVEDDYRPLADDYVTLPAGQTETTFTITPRTDDSVEPDEVLTATIVSDPDIDPQPYQIGAPSQASIVVESGDVPELNISGGGSVREGGTTTFTIVANQPMVEDTTINFQVGGSATPGQDYQVLSGIVVMRAGSSAVTIPLRTFSDDVIFYPSDMIVANWPARVGTVAVDAGEFVLQGSPVLDLTEPAISVKLKLSGTERAKVEVGMEAQIQLEAGGTQYPGIITELDDSATVGTDKTEVYEGVVSATGKLPNVDGASVSIDITLAERKNVLAVPIAAVLKSGSGNFVRVVNDKGRLERVKVELGLAQDEYVEITKGLKGDELVVVSVTSAGQ
ncbi:MAG: hypothetical protein RLZZ467_1083, partial [Gemmatimonadota bacterium]